MDDTNTFGAVSPKTQTEHQDDLGPNFGNLLEIVNKLQDKLSPCGHTLQISLPQIVVVGCQSAGKSSVLENIVGREFLPRGSGVVTRRPTVVQVLKAEEDYAYAVFTHKPQVIFQDFNDVKKEIIDETNREPGPVGFSSVPILLKIYLPETLKLTLVDLPGLIRITLDNQSEDAITEIRNMVSEYISAEKSLILAVSPANQDIANSDALEIARTVDPERKRTIGVLTKIDLMDEGTNAKDILENKTLPLNRGFVGVLNRSQKDIDDGQDIDYSLEKERKFFASHPNYKHMADRLGTPYLKKMLSEQLYSHIKEHLPSVEMELKLKLDDLRRKLKDFKAEAGRNLNDPFSVQFYMVKLVQKFMERFQRDIFGYSEEIPIDTLSAGAMINFNLYRDIQRNFKLPKIPDQKKLLTIIANLHGIRNCLSIPSLALETVANQLLTQYIGPLEVLIDKTADLLRSHVDNSSKILESHPSLRSEVSKLIKKAISDANAETKENIEKHMQAEMYFVNTYHQDFKFPNLKKKENFFPMKLWDCRVLKEKEDGTSYYVDEEELEEEEDSKEEDSIQHAISYSSNDDSERRMLVPINSNKKHSIETVEDSDDMDTLDMIALKNESAKINANILEKTIEKYLTIQLKHIGDVAFKYVLFFLVKKVMDFVKMNLLATVLDNPDRSAILKDCQRDFNRMKHVEETCKCLEEAVEALQSF